MYKLIVIAIGKAVQALASLRGGGSSLPGLVVQKLSPNFALRILQRLPYGTVVISGTNGKTTTTKIVTELLQGAGLRVFTNNSGSNFMRGVISSLLRSVSIFGRLDADIAVLELDEAHAVDFARRIQPRYTLLLNVMRDQMDRFGEIDYTATLLAAVAKNTTEVIVFNREDRRIMAIANAFVGGAEKSDNSTNDSSTSNDESDNENRSSKKLASTKSDNSKVLASTKLDSSKVLASTKSDSAKSFSTKKILFGLDTSLLAQFPQDDELYSAITTTNATDNATANATDNATNNATAKATTKATAKSAGALSCEQVDVCLSAIDDNLVSFTIDGQCHRRTLELRGIYNAYNAAAALALVRQILPDGNSAARTQQLLDVLSKIKSAFGRGETFVINETKVELLLVKNPGGFRLALESFSHSGVINMIAINDDYADGRDMSWLFDVPFDALRQYGVQMLSGVRAWDMALRLDYDDVFVAAIQQDLASALTKFLQIEPASTHRIYCTYTAMLLIRKLLGNLTLVEKVM